MFGYKTRKIYLDNNDVKKVSEFFKEEFGIEEIMSIQAKPSRFEIIAFDGDLMKEELQTPKSLEKSIKAFKDFYERYSKKVQK